MLSTAYLRQSVQHHGKRVSRAHQILLTAYEHEVGHFVYINQGRRTIAEQWGFWNHYQRYGWPLAAYPSQNAPHIKRGLASHALDINAPQPAHGVADFYRRHGVHVSFNVASEAWHMDTLDEASLLAAARRLAAPTDKLRHLTKGERHLVQRLAFHRAVMAREAKTGKGPQYEINRRWAQYYKAQLTLQMKRVAAAAKKAKSWKPLYRGIRYQILQKSYHNKL